MRFAIANPEHAPYGRAAEAVLRKHGLWQSLQPYLVLGENISQAAQFATTGNAVGGIIAHSLALSPAFKIAAPSCSCLRSIILHSDSEWSGSSGRVRWPSASTATFRDPMRERR